MPFEYPTQRGVIRLLRTRSGWVLEFSGCRSDDWSSADDAVQAALAIAPGWFAGTAFASMCPMSCWTGGPWARIYDRGEKQDGS
jgi:hypothetical protein